MMRISWKCKNCQKDWKLKVGANWDIRYTSVEQNVLNLMERTDFNNLFKRDVISFTSKLGELRTKVAKDVLVQYSEFVGLMKVALTE